MARSPSGGDSETGPTHKVEPSSISRAIGAWRGPILGVLLGVIGAIAMGLIVAGPLAITHRQDLPLERAYGHYAIAVASRLTAGHPRNPLALDPRATATGRDEYTGSCAECHGATGDGKGVFGQATYPPATDLTSADAKEKSDAELFWITKSGLSFTGMPGFADQYDDTQIWALVSYLRALQRGQADPVVVPTPTRTQLAVADPHGNAVQRGAVVYFASGCQSCHGAIGDAPGNLALSGGGREAGGAVRRGRRGMPAYGPDQIGDAQLADLEAYLSTFAGQQQGLAPGQFRRVPSNG